jgi:hypothetical protein
MQAAGKEQKSAMKKPGQGGDREDLERYGVWVKADPEDVAEPEAGIDFDVAADIPDMKSIDGSESTSFLTEEEEEILGSVESMGDENELEALEAEFGGEPSSPPNRSSSSGESAAEAPAPISFDDFEVEEIDLPSAQSSAEPAKPRASETSEGFDSVDMDDFLEGGSSAAVEAFPAEEKAKPSRVEEFSVDDFLDEAPSDDSIPEIVQDEDPLDIELEFDDTISEEFSALEGDEGSAEQLAASEGSEVDFDDAASRSRSSSIDSRFDEPTEIDIDEIVSIDGPSQGFEASFDENSSLQIDEGNALSVHEEAPSEINISESVEEANEVAGAESFESVDVEVPLDLDDSLRIDESPLDASLKAGSSIDDSVLSEAGFDEIEEIEISEEGGSSPLPVDGAQSSAASNLGIETEEDMPIQDSFDAPPEAIDDIAEVEKSLSTTGEALARVETSDSGSTELLLRIARELEGIKSDIHSIKDELATLKSPARTEEAEIGTQEGEKAKGFFDEEDDEKIALTGDELDNILNTADFTEETGQDSAPDVFGEEVDLGEAGGEASELSDSPDVISSLDDEEISLLHEVDVAPMTEQPENLSYLDEEIAESKTDLEPDFGDITMNEPPLEEPNIEEISFDDTLDASIDEGTEELPVVLDELEGTEAEALPEYAPAAESEELAEELSEEAPTLEKAPLEEILLNEPRDQEEAQEEIEEVFVGDSVSGSAIDEADATPASPRKDDKAPMVPDSLKEDIKSVLNYMDQLLESLPEDKIEEFARSDHFKVYKRLFEELGLI